MSRFHRQLLLRVGRGVFLLAWSSDLTEVFAERDSVTELTGRGVGLTAPSFYCLGASFLLPLHVFAAELRSSGYLMQRTDSLEKTLSWERLKAREGNNRG